MPRGSTTTAFAALARVGSALARGDGLRASLDIGLAALQSAREIVRGAVFLVDQEGIGVAAGVGIPGEGLTARYQPGEGLIGRVIQTGKAVVVPATGREPLLMNRAFQRRRSRDPASSFFCVAIQGDGAAAGALAVDLPFAAGRDYEAETDFLSAVAAMMAQAVRAQRLVEAERKAAAGDSGGDAFVGNLVGSSGAMRQVYEQLAHVAPTATTVLVRGESGTGKELIAEALHLGSPRRDRPFVKVSCAALPDTLIESELFGHEKGAFTGAQARKPGRFELAHGGTIFLDEVGELNVATQAKLLRVLQEHALERLGGTSTVKVDVRVVAATNRDLEAAILQRQFREDLYYRLNVFPIFVPPLRDRRPDVMLLADHFLAQFSRRHGRRVKRIATPAIDMLMSYHWPGNVRELENTIERAVLTCEGQVIHAHDLPPTLQTAEASGTLVRSSLADAVGQYEKDLLLDALKSARGNRARAARLLGTTERIVGYKIRKHRIEVARFRREPRRKRA